VASARGGGTGSAGAPEGDRPPATIVGSASAMQEVFRAIGRLSRSMVTVLVTGESGTGKELVARALHEHSPCSDGPFIAVNTPAVPPELLESEGRQVVATTHSPMLASAVTPQCLRLLRRDGTGGYGAIDFGPTQHEKDVPRTKNPHFYASEMEKLKRLVERPFGELLFSRAVVIGDGATERAFFPPILRAALGSRAHGISVIDSGGMNNNLVSAVIKFAHHAEFPIVIFADSDTAGAERVRQLVGQSKLDESTEVVWASESSTHADSSQQDRSVAIERMMIDASSEACKAMGNSVADETDERDLLSALQEHKGAIGTTLAKEFLSTHPYTDGSNWPKPLLELTELLRAQLDSKQTAMPAVAP